MTRSAGNLRKADRVEIQIPVRLTRQSFDAKTHTFFISSLRDLSCEGAFVNTSAGYPEGTLLDLEFDLPFQSAPTQTIQTLAQVARSEPEVAANPKDLGLGMRFVMMTLEEKENLESFILQKKLHIKD